MQPSGAGRLSLAPEVVENAALRLRWVVLFCAGITLFTGLIENWLQPEMAGILETPLVLFTRILVVLLAGGIAAAQYYGWTSAKTLLKLGVAFDVAFAFSLSASESVLPLPAGAPVIGVSAVSIWIVAAGLLIPNRPAVKLATGLACASTWPAAYYLNLALHGYAALPTNRLLAWAYLPYVVALGTYALARRTYAMEFALQKARDLGSYQIVSLIGEGGMGQVWRARHSMLARDAAIKVIRADLLSDLSGSHAEVTRRRFRREARAIASLQCPHTVYLFDFGVSPDGSFYYVMELLDGISLDVLVGKFGPQPAGRVVHILRQVCESLEEAHRRGMIHRDIKPSNIFICLVGTEYDFAKVLDFGLVKHVSLEESRDLTFDGSAAGTPAYMAPEIALGEKTIDGRADLYGLGCVAYYLLTGLPVFEEKTPTAAALAHVQKNPVPPSQRSEMPVAPGLEEIVLRCLAKKPEDRPRSAQELGRLLDACTGMPKWTREDAADWWQTCLPESSSYRIPRQPETEPATPAAVVEESGRIAV
ncbi:MAG TPA: protein kinase [Bryobacteraceae bacterium]|nr:protein kinase [Bryobacteraceae bacterium]